MRILVFFINVRQICNLHLTLHNADAPPYNKFPLYMIVCGKTSAREGDRFEKIRKLSGKRLLICLVISSSHFLFPKESQGKAWPMHGIQV